MKILFLMKWFRRGLKTPITMNGRNVNLSKKKASPRMLRKLWEQHQNSKEFNGDIFLIKADENHHTKYANLKFINKVSNTLFWENNISGNIKIKTFPSSHGDLIGPVNADALAEAIHDFMNSHFDGTNFLNDDLMFLKNESEL